MNILRPYQQAAVEATFREWQEHDSTVAILPTGTGKTQIFCEIIRRMQPAKALVLAHRSELVYQAFNRLKSFGLDAEIEMADLRANAKTFLAPVVVSTVQTQAAGGESKRMHRFDPDDFSVVICDEAHHFTSPQFVKVLNHYRQNPNLKIFGCTATPDRADEEALGKVFKSVAYNYEILDAINDGWLVPIHQQLVTIESLDFSAIRTTAGDLNGGDLAAVMEAEKNLHGIASSTIEIIGDKKTIVFTASVRQAEMLSNIFNRHKSGMSDWICGETPKDDRRQKLSDFSSGEKQIMVNCGVLGEGFDEPSIEVVIQARPTKSRCLYSQQIGRATRPLARVVDGLEYVEDRLNAIAKSKKPRCLVVDFIGNSGRHKLMTTADILGGKFTDEEIDFAELHAKSKKQVNMSEELQAARDELKRREEERRKQEAARKARLIGKATFKAHSINPFDVFQLDPERARGWDSGKVLSEKQVQVLLKQGIDPTGMPYGQANQVLKELFRRWNNKLCSLKQSNWLLKKGYDPKNMSMKEASHIMDAWAKNGWKKPSTIQSFDNPSKQNDKLF